MKIRVRIRALVKRCSSSLRFDHLAQGYQEKKIYADWLRNGRPVPPPRLAKLMIVREYARRFGLQIFVETGTYYGDMIAGVQNIFNEIYSIELSQDLFEKARKRFGRKHHITLLRGDSTDILPEVLVRVKRPCLFWLDGHWSGGVTAMGRKKTPIMEEINHILRHDVRGHVILADDARLFTGLNDYPTLDELRDRILSGAIYETFEVKDDIIRIH